MTVAELVCELLYAGKTRAEIAGYDDLFMKWVLCRPRDDHGNLVRVPEGMPSWMAKYLDAQGHWTIRDPVPFGAMYRQVLTEQGLSKDQREREWRAWLQNNPQYDR